MQIDDAEWTKRPPAVTLDTRRSGRAETSYFCPACSWSRRVNRRSRRILAVQNASSIRHRPGSAEPRRPAPTQIMRALIASATPRRHCLASFFRLSRSPDARSRVPPGGLPGVRRHERTTRVSTSTAFRPRRRVGGAFYACSATSIRKDAPAWRVGRLRRWAPVSPQLRVPMREAVTAGAAGSQDAALAV